MRLAFSNIAWKPPQDAEVAALLRARGVEGVEIAPTAVWPRPLEVDSAQLRAYRARWERDGLRIVALQALLYGHPELTVFESEAARQRTSDHLAGMIRVAGELGAQRLVFGSPRNRRRGDLARDAAGRIAVDFFRRLGDTAERHRAVLCIEPNPQAYGCDFVTCSREAAALVHEVDHPGFGLHLDSGAMAMAGEDAAAAIGAAGERLLHFHVSQPQLAAVSRSAQGVDHGACAGALRAARYPHWCSVEMRAPEDEREAPAAVAGALDLLGDAYAA